MFVFANLAMLKLINVIILGHHMGRGHPRHLPDQPKEVHPRHQNGELIHIRTRFPNSLNTRGLGNLTNPHQTEFFICEYQVFAGLKKKKDRDSLIAYLEQSTSS